MVKNPRAQTGAVTAHRPLNMPVAIDAVTSADIDDVVHVADADADARDRADLAGDRRDAPVALSVPRRNRSAGAGAGAGAVAGTGNGNGNGVGPRAGAASRRGSPRQPRRSGAARRSRDGNAREGSREMTRVKSVINMWEIEDEWWREEPIRRRYWRLRLETGQEVTVFEDLETGRWFQQDY